MSSENDPAPTNFRGAHPYGSDQPAAAGPLLSRGVGAPHDEMLFVGMVTDCSTNSYSCTVSIPMKTGGFGVPCLWLSSGINRFGGCSDYCPPEVGSTVFIYLMKGQDFGVVLGQVPAVVEDPKYPGGGAIDPAQYVTAFNEDTGQVMKDLQMGGSALSGFQSMPNDAFPGDKGFYNELGVGIGILRTAFYAKASDTAKIEGFMLEDLIRMTAQNFDAFTGACDVYIRNDKSLLTSEICHSMAHFETMGAIGEEIKNEKLNAVPLWRHRNMTGYFYDLRRQFVAMPAKDDKGNIFQLGLSESLESSDGFRIERSIVGGGIIKSRQVGVPVRIRTSEAMEGAKDERKFPEEGDLNDFAWKYDKHGDITPQMRDAIAWIIGRQGTARINPYNQDGENPDFQLQDESETGFAKGNKGADTEAGGHFRGVLESIDVQEIDPTGLTKPRAIKINDSWIFILPDGSVSLRDGLGTAITLTRGHIDLSGSKDVNITAGRNVNIKAGHDINLNAHDSIDVTAGTGQARVFAKRTAFIHSEDGGVLISTNGAGLKGELDKDGEEFDSAGIILKPHNTADVVMETRSLFVQAHQHILLGRNGRGRPSIYVEAEQMMHKVGQAHWQLGGGRYVQFSNNEVSIDTDGSINTEANVYALFGTMKMNTTHDEHEGGDFCNVPGNGYQILVDRLGPLYNGLPSSGAASVAKRNGPRQKCNVDRDDSPANNPNFFDWNTLHSTFDRLEIAQVIFSLRTERDYGTEVDDFSWTEQPWMREWTGATGWGDDAHTSVRTSNGGIRETWCYPGYKYWTGSVGLKLYTEQNVEPNGNPVKRSELKSDGGSFRDTSFKSMKRHP